MTITIGVIDSKRDGTHKRSANFPKEKIMGEMTMSNNSYQKFEEDNWAWLAEDFIKINQIEPKISWIDFVDKEYAKLAQFDFEVDR